MNIKTLTGKSIQAALAEARHQLGDDVVLMESTAATGDTPARIKVMIDEQTTPSQPARTGFGYDASAPRSQDQTEEGALQQLENFSAAVGEVVRENEEEPPARNGHASHQHGRSERLFPERAQDASSSNPSHREEMLEAQLGLLNERLDAIERRFGEAVIGSGQRWAALPLYSKLTDVGLRPGTVTKLFDRLAERGHEPEDDHEELRWAAAQELRDLVNVTTPKQAPGSLMLIGPSGAGKTSLLLKLATHKNFYARRRPAILVIQPRETEQRAYQNPVDLYRRFGLPVQSVQSQDEVKQALRRVQDFDQLLIDTPPMPTPRKQAHRMLQRVRRLTDAFMPLQVHLTLSTARALDAFDDDFLRGLPLEPDAAALTHLDETPRWGRIAEWIRALDVPVQFASTGSAVPDDARSFSASWFVEEIMDLG